MTQKFLFILGMLCCICVSPSYTNTCAKPGADFLNTGQECVVKEIKVRKSVRRPGAGFEVSPLQLINIQL